MMMQEEFDMIEKIPAIVFVRRNADGVIRQFEDTFFGDFIWSEGNYGCDCNRALFFARAAEELDPEKGCSDSLYAVRIIAKDDQRELYEDGDWSSLL